MYVYILYIQYTLNKTHTMFISDLANLRMYHGYCVKNIYITSCNNNLSYVKYHVLQQVLYIIDFIQSQSFVHCYI
jgi:hypothetical protein